MDVFAFLGRIPAGVEWRPNHEEVVEVLTPTVAELWDPAIRREHLFTNARWPEGLLVDGIPVGDRVLWGMTLRLLDDLVPRLLAGEWAGRAALAPKVGRALRRKKQRGRTDSANDWVGQGSADPSARVRVSSAPREERLRGLRGLLGSPLPARQRLGRRLVRKDRRAQGGVHQSLHLGARCSLGD